MIDEVKDICTDANGNVYITGNTVSATNNSIDVLVIKYDAQGNQIWVEEYHTFGVDKGKCIATDKLNNIYVAGFTESANDEENTLLLKYNSNGILLWKKEFDLSNKEDLVNDMVIDENANIYLTGSGRVNTGYTNMLTLKYDSAGTLLWNATYDGAVSGWDDARKIALGINGDVFITGESAKVMLPQDIAITTIKYDINGNQIWEHNFQGVANDYDYPKAIVVDSLGYAYVGGGTNQLISFPDDYDYITIKYDLNGDTLWTRTYSGLPFPANDGIVDIALDNNLNLMVTGNITGANSQDIATIQYDNNGNMNWIIIEDTGQYSDEVIGIEIDDSNNIYIANAFLIKYDSNGNEIWRILMDTTSLYPNPTSLALSEEACDIYVGADGMFLQSNGLWAIDAVTIQYRQCLPSAILETPLLLSRELIKIVDILGKKSTPQQKGLLLYIYDDGTVEKKILID
jgi:hypothetical protein